VVPDFFFAPFFLTTNALRRLSYTKQSFVNRPVTPLRPCTRLLRVVVLRGGILTGIIYEVKNRGIFNGFLHVY